MWKKLFLKKYAIFTGRLQHMCFPKNIAKVLRTPILKNICERLRLKIPRISLNGNSKSTDH